MTDEPLVDVDDLKNFEGAPFEENVVETASASIRADAGWHIAPEITETLTLDSAGDDVLLLPTLKLNKVESVKDVSDEDNPRELEGWRKSSSGMIERRCGFPCGFETVEVKIKHGYEECPPELLALIAERAQQADKDSRINQEQSGQEMISYSSGAGGMTTSSKRVPRALARYMLPARP